MFRALINLAAGIRELAAHRGDPPCSYATDSRPCLGRRDSGQIVTADQPLRRRACRTPSHRKALIAEATAAIRDSVDHLTQH